MEFFPTSGLAPLHSGQCRVYGCALCFLVSAADFPLTFRGRLLSQMGVALSFCLPSVMPWLIFSGKQGTTYQNLIGWQNPDFKGRALFW